MVPGRSVGTKHDQNLPTCETPHQETVTAPPQQQHTTHNKSNSVWASKREGFTCGCWFQGFGLVMLPWTALPRDRPSPGPPKISQNSFFSSLSGCLLVELWGCLKRQGLEMRTSPSPPPFSPGGTEHDQTKTVKPTPTHETPLHAPHSTHTNTQTHNTTVWPKSVWPKSAMTCSRSSLSWHSSNNPGSHSTVKWQQVCSVGV